MQVAILSDIHYAGPTERARGNDYELRGLDSPVVRGLLRTYRRFVWLRNPLDHGHLLEDFIAQPHANTFDYVIANGDYSCDSGFVGVMDDAACDSARECLLKLRRRFGERFRATIGDHELGKLTLAGRRGGLRLASWTRATGELRLDPLWQLRFGRYVLLGVTSTLIALPAFEPDALAHEWSEWQRLRREHLDQVRAAFCDVGQNDRLLLFCHDPTALPWLAEEPEVRAKLPQLDQTIIGHLHSSLILWKSRLLAGMPQIRFLGHTALRLSSALGRARLWKPFRVRLCPAIAGIELLKDGGYLEATLNPDGDTPAQIKVRPLPRGVPDFRE